MAETEIARLRRRLSELKAENASLRVGAGVTANARDAARIVDEIAGSDGGTDPFAAAVRATRMPMVISNPRLPDNPIVFVNDAFCRLCNYSREEILGRNCRFLQGPDTDPATVAKIRAAIDAAVPVRTDILNYRKTGETFWNRLLMAPVRDAEGRLAYFFASQVDVTIERERLEGLEIHNAALMAEVADRLRTQEEASARLLFATEAGRLGVWELDLATEELSASPVCKDNFGRHRDEPFTYRDLEEPRSIRRIEAAGPPRSRPASRRGPISMSSIASSRPTARFAGCRSEPRWPARLTAGRCGWPASRSTSRRARSRRPGASPWGNSATGSATSTTPPNSPAHRPRSWAVRSA